MGSRTAPPSGGVRPFSEMASAAGFRLDLGGTIRHLLDNKFAEPKQARPRPSGIGGFRAKAVPVTHPPVTCGTNSDFYPGSLSLNNCAKILSDSMRPYLLASGCRVVMSNSIAERPSCPTCKHRMGLARISPGERGFEDRTFECSTCHSILKVSFPVDPMKTDAVGWMASELRPPR
jgi:hypothetical protein